MIAAHICGGTLRPPIQSEFMLSISWFTAVPCGRRPVDHDCTSCKCCVAIPSQALAIPGLGSVTQDGKTLRLAQDLLVQWARSAAKTRKLARRLAKASAVTGGKPEDAAIIAIHACRDIMCAGGGGTGSTNISEDATAHLSCPAPKKAPASTEGAGRAVTSVRPDTLVSMVMATCATLVSQLASAAATPFGKVKQPAGSLLPGAESIATVMMAVAMLLMMIKMLAVCGICFGKAESTDGGAAPGDDVDEVIAFEAPGSEVRPHTGFLGIAPVCARRGQFHRQCHR